MLREDMTAFFSAAEFADLATIGGVEVNVIFEAPSADRFGGTVDTTQPRCWVATDRVRHASEGSAVTLAGVDYTIARIEPDGTGISLLTLYPKDA